MADKQSDVRPPDDDRLPTWVLLECEPSDIPAAVRLRRALKQLLRVYGIRVKRVCVKLPEGENVNLSNKVPGKKGNSPLPKSAKVNTRAEVAKAAGVDHPNAK